MPSWLLSLLSGPIVGALVQAYKAKLAAGNTADQIATDLAGRELALQQSELEAQARIRIAEVGVWYEPDHLMGYFVAIYLGKIIVWDTVLGLGTTSPLAGWAATTANLIVGFYYAKRGAESVARIVTSVFRR